ncbi:hypothetical protein QUB68_28180 [Microcoleus sp. A006_D1]|uniref:hypothetical protein n=1 Tax=Microcoleus sp. A006_D1 TaxID=3055267 RepID=UPI002FD38038
MHSLTFEMRRGTSESLLEGLLHLSYPDESTISYRSTSGCAGWQRPGDEWARGKGPIPAGRYEIPAKPYWLDTRGIEGYFFHITPDPVVSGDLIRSELGIHFDANVPGTAGCIGLMNLEGWQGFCRRLLEIAALGVDKVPLTVRY